MFPKVNSICFSPDYYDDESDLWYDLLDVVRALIKNNYIINIRLEDFGLVFLDFESANKELGAPYPYWLTPEKAEQLWFMNEENKVDESDV